MFSDLPRPLPLQVEQAGMLSAMDVESLKEVENFVTSLEFCDSVIISIARSHLNIIIYSLFIYFLDFGNIILVGCRKIVGYVL